MNQVKDKVKEPEAYENYLELYKLGVRIVGNSSPTPTQAFNGTSRSLKYELTSKAEESKVKLVPLYHSKRVVQDPHSLAMPKEEVYQVNKFLRKKAADTLAVDFHTKIAQILTSDESYIIVYKEPVEVSLYEIYDSLASCWDRFKLIVQGSNVVLVPRLAAGKFTTLEDVLEKTGKNLSKREKDTLRTNLEIMDFGQ